MGLQLFLLKKMKNLTFKHWHFIAAIILILVILESGKNLINSKSPSTESKKINSSISTSSILVSEAASSSSTSSHSLVSKTLEEKEDHQLSSTKVVVREKFRQDGSLETRETEKVESVSSSVRVKTEDSSKSASVKVNDSSVFLSTTSVAVKSDTSTESIVAFSDQNSVGIGPVVWLTSDGAYGGLSYRLISLDLLNVNGSAVVGTRINALPDVDLGAGIMVSRSFAPGLELGIVGVIKPSNLITNVGLGLSYQF